MCGAGGDNLSMYGTNLIPRSDPGSKKKLALPINFSIPIKLILIFVVILSQCNKMFRDYLGYSMKV